MANIYVSVGTSFSATINITYPSGSTCTVTNYKKTRTAPNTTGTWACKVDEVGYYTVKCVSGSKSKEAVITITANGQTVSVTLQYEMLLFGGSETWTLKPRYDGYGALTISNNQLTLTGNKAYGGADALYACSAFYPSMVAKGSYATLTASVSSVTTPANVYLIVQSDMTANPSGSGYVAYSNMTKAGTFSVVYPDGTYYVGLSVGGSSAVTVSKVWLE